MKVIIQLQYSLTDSRVFNDVKNITQSSLHPTQPNPWMNSTHDQLCTAYVTHLSASDSFTTMALYIDLLTYLLTYS